MVNARINKFLTDDYSPSFRIDLHWKDLNNVLETGYELGTPLPLTKEVQNMFNYLRGAGEGVIPLVVALVAQLIIRIPAVYLLAHFFGVNYMYYGFGIGWVAGALISIGYYASGRWKRHRTMAEMDDLNSL